jgi:Tol biopolymer transport system component
VLDADIRSGRALVLAASIAGVLALSPSAPTDFVTVALADSNAKPWDAAAVSISANGRYVAFASFARLSAGDQNNVSDIYVLDRQTGGVSLETSPAGARPGSAIAPHLSETGRFLVYEAPEDTFGMPVRMVMLRDRLSGVTQPLPRAAGAPASSSRGGRISANGSRVAFSSEAITLVDGADANGSAEDVYLFDIAAQRYERVSLDGAGRQRAAGGSYGPAISADGRYVAFSSSAALDEPPATPQRRSVFVNVYLRDTLRGATVRISVAEGGRPPNGPSYEAAISADGRYVAFVSEATNLVKQRDTNRAPDVYLRDTVRNVTELVSCGVSGSPANGTSAHPSMSADGRIVVFQSDASNLVCAVRCADTERDINLVADIFARNRESRATQRISRGSAPWMEPSLGPIVDGTGTVIAFSSRHPRSATDDSDDFDLFVWTVTPLDDGGWKQR